MGETAPTIGGSIVTLSGSDEITKVVIAPRIIRISLRDLVVENWIPATSGKTSRSARADACCGYAAPPGTPILLNETIYELIKVQRRISMRRKGKRID